MVLLLFLNSFSPNIGWFCSWANQWIQMSLNINNIVSLVSSKCMLLGMLCHVMLFSIKIDMRRLYRKRKRNQCLRELFIPWGHIALVKNQTLFFRELIKPFSISCGLKTVVCDNDLVLIIMKSNILIYYLLYLFV